MLFWQNQWDLKARMSFAELDVLARVGDKYLTELFHTSVSFYVNDPKKNKPWGLGTNQDLKDVILYPHGSTQQ